MATSPRHRCSLHSRLRPARHDRRRLFSRRSATGSPLYGFSRGVPAYNLTPHVCTALPGVTITGTTLKLFAWRSRGRLYRRRWGFLSVPAPYSTTVWFCGLPYYYANYTYYTWDGITGYEWGGRPAASTRLSRHRRRPIDAISSLRRTTFKRTTSAVSLRCTTPPSNNRLRPDSAGGGVTPEVAAGKRADYFRAEAACLDARGYSVR